MMVGGRTKAQAEFEGGFGFISVQGVSPISCKIFPSKFIISISDYVKLISYIGLMMFLAIPFHGPAFYKASI